METTELILVCILQFHHPKPFDLHAILLDSEEFLVHFAPSCKQLLARLESLVAVVRYSGNNNETKHKTGRDVSNG